ncbi:MAG: GNAT family N-acetyltransferase [Acetatifactor sp.]|nr:GNAT family N-acetyltransferase [Acetatifactor sp.]
MNFQLVPIENNDLKQYKTDMQDAFQRGYEEEFGQTKEEILPEEDIDQSLDANGSMAYKALVDGKMVGGAIVVINSDTQYNHLAFLFVKYGTQSKGIGKAIWDEIEKLYPQTKVWETCTPYFEKRNIHFYVNKCGFHIVEFFNEKHQNPNMPGDSIDDDNAGMFVLKKQM